MQKPMAPESPLLGEVNGRRGRHVNLQAIQDSSFHIGTEVFVPTKWTQFEEEIIMEVIPDPKSAEDVDCLPKLIAVKAESKPTLTAYRNTTVSVKKLVRNRGFVCPARFSRKNSNSFSNRSLVTKTRRTANAARRQAILIHGRIPSIASTSNLATKPGITHSTINVVDSTVLTTGKV